MEIKDIKKGKQPEQESPQVLNRAGVEEIELIKTLYANNPELLSLKNRRITSLGVEGIAVIYDDEARKTGLAVAKLDGINRLVEVSRLANGKFDLNGQEITISGWVHSQIKTHLIKFCPWPQESEVTPL